MKYIVILGDGMADEPIASLGGKTPLEIAKKPVIDSLAKKGEVGLVYTIPKGLSPGSDVANLSVMGYDPEKYYSGRSPLEAISMGIKMKPLDISFRCNLVTLTENEPYSEKKIIDHSADEITTKEAEILIESIDEAFGNQFIKFYPGVSYRHALVWDKGSINVELEPPHNILEQKISDYVPKGDNSPLILEMMEKSYDILNNHEINKNRREKGLNAANSIWIWGEGTKPTLPSFQDKYGIKGSMISAVDLLKGIAIASEMNSIDVEGATGNIDTNYKGKVDACLEALKSGYDFVYLHIEAPDECGHRGELDNKIKAIELIDNEVVKPIVDALNDDKEAFRIMVLPDHATPIAIRTHTSEPIPYMIYDSTKEKLGMNSYNEVEAKHANRVITVGHELMDYFLEK